MQPCRAVIRLDAIRGNAALLRAGAAGAKLCAVVKADAYGHGGAMVCQALAGVADCFAVALVEEGVRLRLAGVSADILVLVPPLSIEEAVRAALYGLTISVGDGQDIALVSRALAGRGLSVRVHLQVNTGMNRFGFEEAPFAALCGEGLPPCMRAEGIYSHFYAPHDAAVTREQFSRFCAFRARAEQAFGRLTAHIAATGGVLAAEGYCLDLVRPGIGLYGYAPQGCAPPCAYTRRWRQTASIGAAAWAIALCGRAAMRWRWCAAAMPTGFSAAAGCAWTPPWKSRRGRNMSASASFPTPTNARARAAPSRTRCWCGRRRGRRGYM